MTVPSVNCEAKKLAYRQTKDGLVVSFLIHPSDMPDTLAVAPLGQRYMLVLAMIGDDEEPMELPSQREAPAAERPGVEPSASPPARARASTLGRELYANLPSMEQARVRAGVLPKDERFRAWACEQKYGIDGSRATLGEDLAAQFIRDHCCHGATRAHIGVDPEAYRKFLALETIFRIAVGEIAEPR